MGILGLTSFMNGEILNQVLEQVNLKNCTILIDGYSFLHQIHSLNSLQSVHGGNYDELADKLSEAFLSFKKCKINAIFLLDGGREKSDRKIKTQLKRASQRIKNAFSVTNLAVNSSKMDLTSLINNKFHTFSNLLPILSFKIYLHLLNKFEMQHFQCTFEADYDLACLANELQCPLVSLDSDFYVYDLKYGYISFDYFYFSSVVKNEPGNDYHISAFIFKIDNFVQYINKKQVEKNFRFRKEMLPIFAVICGNDYVDKSLFKSLINSFDSSNNNLRNKRIGKTAKSYIKKKNDFYFKIIRWLSQFQSPTECVNVMLKLIKGDQHDLVRKVIDDSMEEYLCKKKSLVKYFKSQICQDIEFKLENLSIDGEMLAMEISSFNGGLIDGKFIKKFVHFETTRYCLDVLMHRKTMFSCQIEIPSWPSCYISSTNIRKFYYTLVFKIYEPESLTEESVIIDEYLRDKSTLSIFKVNLCQENELFLSIGPDLVNKNFIYKHLFKLNDQIISNLMSDNFIEKKMSKKIKNFLAIIYFWLNSEKTEQDYKIFHECKNANFLKAFIISFLKSAIVDPAYELLKNKSDQSNEDEGYFIVFENNENLINEFLSIQEDNTPDIFRNVRQFLASNEKNFSHLKDIRNKLIQFSVILTQNVVQKNRKNQKFLNVNLVHCLSEFQAIYLSFFYASTIARDLETIDLNHFFNGTFLHNFKEELDQKMDADAFIEDVFGRQSFFHCLYKEILFYFTETFCIKESFFEKVSKRGEEIHPKGNRNVNEKIERKK